MSKIIDTRILPGKAELANLWNKEESDILPIMNIIYFNSFVYISIENAIDMYLREDIINENIVEKETTVDYIFFYPEKRNISKVYMVIHLKVFSQFLRKVVDIQIFQSIFLLVINKQMILDILEFLLFHSSSS